MGLSLAHSVAFLRLISQISDSALLARSERSYKCPSFSGVEWEFLILYGKMREAENACPPLTTCSLNFHLYIPPVSWDMCSLVTAATFFEKKKKKRWNRWTRFKWKGTVSCPTCPQPAVLQAVHLQLFHLFLLLFSSKSINNLQNQLRKTRQPIQLQIQVSPLGSTAPHTSLQASRAPILWSISRHWAAAKKGSTA